MINHFETIIKSSLLQASKALPHMLQCRCYGLSVQGYSGQKRGRGRGGGRPRFC